MYFTANGRALPCCIAPFSQRGYENYTLGDATQESLREIWNGPAYQAFRAALHSDAAAEVLRQLRLALEPLGAERTTPRRSAMSAPSSPVLDEEDAIGPCRGGRACARRG